MNTRLIECVMCIWNSLTEEVKPITNMNNRTDVLENLVPIDLKWVLKEEIAIGDFPNILAWLLEY